MRLHSAGPRPPLASTESSCSDPNPDIQLSYGGMLEPTVPPIVCLRGNGDIRPIYELKTKKTLSKAKVLVNVGQYI